MIEFMRSLFGLGGSTRTVVGHSHSIDLKDVAYIKDSKARLTALHHLNKRYRGTTHEPKIRAVYEKTKAIHSYLVSKKRLHELELFHLQNTEHFINTYSVIMDAFEQRHDGPPGSAKGDPFFRKFATVNGKRPGEAYSQTEMVQPENRSETADTTDKDRLEVPRLSVPDILINTYTNIAYEEAVDDLPAAEIGFTSSEPEKEMFLQHISARLGIDDISYVGNALVNIPNSNGSSPTGLVPVIHWKGYLYALNLNDYRLFPVKVYRKSL